MITQWHTREELEHQVVALSKQGVPARAIARALGVSRNTVRALREAKRRLLSAGGATAHPFSWAAFVLWGLPD